MANAQDKALSHCRALEKKQIMSEVIQNPCDRYSASIITTRSNARLHEVAHVAAEVITFNISIASIVTGRIVGEGLNQHISDTYKHKKKSKRASHTNIPRWFMSIRVMHIYERLQCLYTCSYLCSMHLRSFQGRPRPFVSMVPSEKASPNGVGPGMPTHWSRRWT